MKKERINLVNKIENYILQHESKLMKIEIHNIPQLIDYILKKNSNYEL